MAFVQNTTQTLVKQPRVTPQNFVQGTDAAGTFKALVTAGGSGSKVVAVMATTNDGSASHKMTLSLNRSATRYVLGSFVIPVSSGTDGSTSGVDLLSALSAPSGTPLTIGFPMDNDGQKYIFLESGDTLDCTFATALTAATRIDVISVFGDF